VRLFLSRAESYNSLCLFITRTAKKTSEIFPDFMKLTSSVVLLGVLSVAALIPTNFLLSVKSAQNPDARLERENLYRLNNVGVAYLEQFKHEQAATEFKKILAVDPNFTLAQINLAIAGFFLPDMATAATAARAAIQLQPKSPHAHYVLGMILRDGKQNDEAIAAFKKVLESDPADAYANTQIGQIYAQNRKFEEAIAFFTRALESEPYNATAMYNLAQSYLRSGKPDEGRQWLKKFDALRGTNYKTEIGNKYGEKGRYAEGIISAGAESELTSGKTAELKFVDATSALNLKAGFGNKPLSSALNRKITKAEFDNETIKRELVNPFSATIGLLDIDGDGRLDVFAAGVNPSGKPFVKLFHNDGGKFSDVTAKSKLAAGGFISGAVFGNFDNDEKNTQDVLLFGYRTLTLWRNNGDGSFTDVTKDVQLPTAYQAWAMTAAFVDADHDGDLDIFVGNFADLTKWTAKGESAIFPDDFAGTPNKLFRNNGSVDGKVTFADITEQTGLSGGANKTTAVVCTDYDNHRDVDFLVVNYKAPVQLFANQRDGSFKDVAKQVGIDESEQSLSASAGDLNKDGFTDFCVSHGQSRQDSWYLSDGRGRFTVMELPYFGAKLQTINSLIADFDNDGLLDALHVGGGFLSMRNVGGKEIFEYKKPFLRTDFPAFGLRAFAAGDLNNDGSNELLAVGQQKQINVLSVEGASKNYVALSLTGRSSNRSGIATKAEIRSGSLSQKLESYASSPMPAPASMIFGLGYRTEVDALKLTWPAGIVQSELAVKTSTAENVEELDRKGTSCPILYAWNGNEYSFVTDFLGGSAIGARTPAGWNYPDTDEYVRVTGEQLKAHNGVYSLLMNNQLEEVIFFDAVKLLAVDHPAETEIYPNEKLMPGAPFTSFKVWSVKSPQAPVSAVDDKGSNILPLIEKTDHRYPVNFERLPFKGYAKSHAITLDLGQDALKSKQTLLLLHAWIDYADSTSVLAATQAGAQLIAPYLQVINKKGEWETVIPQMGFPAGLPKTMTVDLTGKFLCDDARVRIVTSMRIYWDQITVDTSAGNHAMKVTTLQPMRSELRWRGFPREIAVNEFGLKAYDYRVIEPLAPWKAHLGNYTRFGDVRELLLAPDDMYVITRNGDEMQVDFDATKVPALPKGWKRDFLVFADGFGKDMDLNSARPETIGELPFHNMKSYPHAPGENYPMDAPHLEYLRKYNTRTVSRQMEARWQGVR
jgi:tetratricopeptide (TPR) repeat protein